jgi:hypothetical protein
MISPTAPLAPPPEPALEEALAQAIRTLPPNYNFEVEKAVAKIQSIALRKKAGVMVCLQFPEGLFMFATMLADIF